MPTEGTGDDADRLPAPTLPESVVSSGPPATIMIIDDELFNRALLEDLLQRTGYRTQSMSGGDVALAAIASAAPDLILLDLMMPGMDGCQVARILKADPATAAIPIIIVTAYGDQISHLAGLDAGAEEFLTKPIHVAELLLRVKNLLRLKEFSDFLRKHSVILESQVQARTIDLQYFRTAMDATADAILLVNHSSMRFVEVNAAACAMLGYTRAELQSLDVEQVYLGAPEPLRRSYDSLVAGCGNDELAQIEVRRKDGSCLLVEVHQRARCFGGNWVIADVLRDISKRLHAERMLLASEQHAQRILDTACDAYVALDANGLIIDWNRRGEQLFGWTRAQALGRSLVDTVIAPASRSAYAGALAQLRAGAPAPDPMRELTAQHRDGHALPVELSIWTVAGSHGDTFSAFFHDLSERKKAEQKFKDLLECAPDAMVIVNGAGAMVLVNLQAVKLFGWRREEMVGQPIGMLVPQRLRSKHAGYRADFHAQPAARTMGGGFDLFGLRKDGSEFPVEISLSPLETAEGTLVMSTIRDVTERKEVAQRLHRLAHYDALSGLPNRTLFYDTLKKNLSHAHEQGSLVAVLFIDLDDFKNVNDTLGHVVGDDLLEQFSRRLVDCVRVRDTVGRLGGDEFGVILAHQDDPHGTVVVAQKIREALRRPFALRGHAVLVTTSIGIALYPDDASDPDALIKYADMAMYRAKQAGRDTYRFFTAQMNAELLARLELEAALRHAIEHDEFTLFYQPKVHLDSGRIGGVEALLRWRRPGHGLVSPQQFIAVLEATGLIVRVGSWVIATACRQIGLWTRGEIGPLQVSVNVSGRQFLEGDLDGDVRRALADNDIAPELLELELTESSLMDNTERTIASLQRLKEHGVQISIDDFGTGYSSLAYLRRFPIDKLKIDIAFVRDITSNPDAAAIALAIIGMAHSLKLDVIAEGVETAAQLAYLRRHRCDQMQGYFFSRPLPLAELELLLQQQRRLELPDGSAHPTETLLLVDDEPNILAALERLLRPDGYRILAASSAAEGFELLALHPVQVILCDQRMPGMSGTAFLDRVKLLYPDTFRIILSSFNDLESIMEAVNRGAIYRFYTKPWDNKNLRENVRAAFCHHRLAHEPAHREAMLAQ